MFVSATSPIVLCMYNFVFKSFYPLYSAFAGHDSILVLPVGLYEWKITNIYQTLTTMSKNVLRKLEAEILKILRTFSLSPKLDVG